MRGVLVSVAALLLAVASPAFAASDAPSGQISVVSQDMPATTGLQAFRLHSQRIGRDFEVVVHPPSATAFLPGQKFPVIYALDGGYGLAGQTGLLLGATGAMAPAYVVDITYPPGEGMHRNDDLTHAKAPAAAAGGPTFGGGGAAFEKFLLEDLRPFIEAKFPVDPGRSVLFGHSLGGLFAARVFADKPDAFAGWIIGSASVWADPDVAAAVASAASRVKSARIYLTVGEVEDGAAPGAPARMRNGFTALSDALRNRPAIALKTQIYVGESHLSYYPRLVTDGFPYVLPPLRAQNIREQLLTEASAARYVGTYALPDGRTLTVRLPKPPPGAPPMLQAQVTGIPPVPLLQNGKDRFYNPTSDIDATFDGAGLTMVADGARMRVEKVKAAP